LGIWRRVVGLICCWSLFLFRESHSFSDLVRLFVLGLWLWCGLFPSPGFGFGISPPRPVSSHLLSLPPFYSSLSRFTLYSVLLTVDPFFPSPPFFGILYVFFFTFHRILVYQLLTPNFSPFTFLLFLFFFFFFSSQSRSPWRTFFFVIQPNLNHTLHAPTYAYT
jgi:hypothetical protein